RRLASSRWSRLGCILAAIRRLIRRAREITMTPALERLAELVRQAEAKTRARKIEGETRQAVERLRTVRPASLRAIEQADTDEHLLKDLVRKLAQFKSSLESQTDAE